MSLLVPIHLAATNALANYISNILPDVSVEPRFPDPDKSLPPKAVTVVPAGPRFTYFMDGPQLIGSLPIPNDTVNQQWQYRIAEMEVPFQLDCWTQFDLDRADLIARLDQILSVGDTALSINVGNPSILPAATDSLVLPLLDGWEGSNATYYFTYFDYDQTPDQAMRREYRATYRGNSYCNMTKTIIAPTIKVANILIRQVGDSTYEEFST